MNQNLRISFDTSSAFRNLAYNQMFTLPRFDAKNMTMQTCDAPDSAKFVGSTLPWVWQSSLGNHMALGDFCVPIPPKGTRYRDTQSNHYLAHHNLSTLCSGIALANRLFDCDIIAGQYTFASSVGIAAEAIDAVIKAGDMATLKKYRKSFTSLRHEPRFIDEERDLFEE